MSSFRKLVNQTPLLSSRYFVIALVLIALLAIAGYATGDGPNVPELMGEDLVYTALASQRTAAGDCSDLVDGNGIAVEAKCMEWCLRYQGGNLVPRGKFCCVDSNTGQTLQCD
ncbi:MAG: hypothetical protein MPN21_24135 [Thermoanaerobaculia bacterium]|nr:hypothetical protein [Thermoanaerobaculia bacterium]